MGLFDKKYCDICGDKIGLLGNRKLEDGNCCKACAAKLSPWFSERKQSTVEEIKEQIAYREENREAVAAFHCTRTLGVTTKVLLDEDNRKFMVTSARNLQEANPDVLDYSQITGCYLDIDEDKFEVKQKGADGKEVSYNPPQYGYSYDFKMVINVNHPYFNEMHFRLNPSSVELEPTFQLAAAAGSGAAANRYAPQAAARPAQPAPTANRYGPTAQKSGIGAARPGTAPARPTPAPARPAAQPARPAAQPAAPAVPTRVISSTPVNPLNSAEYMRYKQMGDDIVSALTQVREEIREEIEISNAPVMAVTCPWCGATSIPDPNGCCEYCGGALNG